MKRRLIIVRHAKSDWDDPTLDDFDRPLAPRGLDETPLIAKWLVKQKLHIDQILCSSAKRTRQTAHLLCKGTDIKEEKIEFQDALYLADTTTLLNVIGHCPNKTRQLMLIGHNPGLEDLLCNLCGDDLPLTKSGKLLTTANIAIVALDDEWSSLKPHSGHLITLVRPKELAKQ